MPKGSGAGAAAAKPQADAALQPPARKRSFPSTTVAILVVVAAAAVYYDKFGKTGSDSGLSFEESINAAISQLPEGPMRTQLSDFVQSLPLSDASATAAEPSLRIGQQAAARGVEAKLPVVFIPGFITSGLELWQGRECLGSFFRQRIWGTATMVKMVGLNPWCWLEHMELDGLRGDDPPGVRIRSARGLEAADYVIGPYWVWSKLIEALADIGHTPSSLYLASYDWRLPYSSLEKRDHYFSELRLQLQTFKEVHGKKSVVIAHSMGTNIWQYFMAWVSAPKPDGGGMPASWLEDHVDSVALVAGPLLGAPKVTTGMLTGESAEFTILSGTLGQHLNSIISPGRRRRIFRSYGSAQALLPYGGNAVWGDADGAPDDPEATRHSLGSYFSYMNADGKSRTLATVEEAIAKIHADANASQVAADGESGVRFRKWADTGYPTEASQLDSPPESSWYNPLLTKLPPAPSVTIACLYGVGVPTERAYHMSEALAKSQPAEKIEDGDRVPYLIDRDANIDGASSGVRMVDGDATVPIVSAAYMCLKGWEAGGPRNRAGARTVAREYAHGNTTSTFIKTIREASDSAAHVDIMGNHDLITDLLLLSAGKAAELKERINTDAKEQVEWVHARLPNLG